MSGTDRQFADHLQQVKGKSHLGRKWRTGVIRWFDPQRRFGFVIPEDGADDVFLYWRELKKAEIDESLAKDGQRVRFTQKSPDKPGKCEWQVDRIKLVK